MIKEDYYRRMHRLYRLYLDLEDLRRVVASVPSNQVNYAGIRKALELEFRIEEFELWI